MWFRVTGVAKRTESRSGNKNGRDWSMRQTRVLVADGDFCEVTLPDGFIAPDSGDEVDWLVDVRASGAYLNVQYVQEYPALELV